MAVGLVGAALSPNVWVAAGCCVVLGVGNGTAVACNALLVQRGTFDAMRGRALTFVMSATYLAVAIGEFAGGAFVHEGARPTCRAGSGGSPAWRSASRPSPAGRSRGSSAARPPQQASTGPKWLPSADESRRRADHDHRGAYAASPRESRASSITRRIRRTSGRRPLTLSDAAAVIGGSCLGLAVGAMAAAAWVRRGSRIASGLIVGSSASSV